MLKYRLKTSTYDEKQNIIIIILKVKKIVMYVLAKIKSVKKQHK